MRKSLIYKTFQNGFSLGSSVAELFLSAGGRFKKAVSFLEQGFSLEEAVNKAKFPVIESIFLTLGEKTGNLEGVCTSLSKYYAIKEDFYSRIISIFLKTFFVLSMGVFLAFLLFKSTDSLIPHNFYVFFITLTLVWFLLLFVFVVINPGFTKYVAFFVLLTSYKAGLSFVEIKNLLENLGFFYNKKAEYISDLISLKKEYKVFLKSAEKSGTLDSALERLVELLEKDYLNKLTLFERFFFYFSIVSAAIIVFYSIYLFAVSSFENIFDELI